MTGGVIVGCLVERRLRGMTLKFREEDWRLVNISEDESWCIQSTWMPAGGGIQLGCRLWVLDVQTELPQARGRQRRPLAVVCGQCQAPKCVANQKRTQRAQHESK